MLDRPRLAGGAARRVRAGERAAGASARPGCWRAGGWLGSASTASEEEGEKGQRA